MRFEIDERQPIYRQITDALIRQIARGDWPPGGRLPSIREVAETARVNPNTVARAFQELERTGLVETRRGEGTFVTNDTQAIKACREKTAREIWADFLVKIRELGFTNEEVQRLVAELKEGKEK
ncbi:MAG TPA: GntR family transcriptional regulator [Firmicutes bacterium]|uniref:GntR family transcriptional regulator n=1 Tax=Capillibacterium thermochitinicola TaxID=2699427 RepID=A0A8J6LIJ8_9FIRM|nr:GntR family transcriptional regulator [Capillibacterium thermochitinicola]HHW12024.1 GntR family transcriptional regulator [Bacillota bacterium]